MEDIIEQNKMILDGIVNNYNKLVSKMEKGNYNYYTKQQFMEINNRIRTLDMEIEDINFDIDLKFTKKNNRIFKDKLVEKTNYEKNFEKILPLILYAHVCNFSNKDNNNIKCNECGKEFNGDNYLKRYRQHVKSKHYN